MLGILGMLGMLGMLKGKSSTQHIVAAFSVVGPQVGTLLASNSSIYNYIMSLRKQ